jgi:large subunit ribosomal protein L14e
LVDGPFGVTGVKRQVISLKRLVLTPYTLRISQGIHHKFLKQKFEKAKVLQKFYKSAWGKKILARQRKLSENDFARFVAMKNRRAKVYTKHVPKVEKKKKEKAAKPTKAVQKNQRK